jgi:hypothetical protein
MLTTKDNPYNPFEQYDLWLQFDLEMGYQSCERLGKIVKPLIEEGMSEKEIEDAMDRAIDEIVKYDPLNIYVRATENSTYPIGK